MKAAIGNNLISGIVIAIGTVLAVVILSLWQSRRLQDAGAWLRHTNQVLYQTHYVLDRSMQYELSVKDFLLTRDSSFLSANKEYETLLYQDIDSLKQLTGDNILQQQRIDSLLEYTDRNREVLERAIAMSNSDSLLPSARQVAAGATLRYSIPMRSLLTRLGNEENRLLELRRKINNRTAVELQVVLWGMIVAVMALALVVFKKVRLDLKKEKEARAELSLFNQQLEDEVRAQTASLQRLNEDLERRAAELAASNSELERFAYIASHDLQEPLRMVSSFLQLLEKRYAGQLDEKADQYIHYAVDGAERMKTLVLDLLEYSRVGSSRENFGPVDTAEVIREVESVFRDNMAVSSARMEVGPLPRVNGHKVQLVQLFQNLVGNALKYHGETAPVIRVHAHPENGLWRFSIQDNGIGIDPRFFEKIFIIFQRLHNKSEYSGTGIGLAICKKIVERHGGRIWVESKPGEGSTFYFTIKNK
jgi:signal transduction histidine kinase